MNALAQVVVAESRTVVKYPHHPVRIL